MEELVLEKYTELNFHGIDYLIKVSSSTELVLSIEVEQKSTGDFWQNSFQASYIEEITNKTGNSKKYDVLTYQDLEMLKARKNYRAHGPTNQGQLSKGNLHNASAATSSFVSNNNNNNQTQFASSSNNKRYMILTYIVEFDKVHYPLPLNYQEMPDPMQLKATIRRLRMEIDEMRTGGSILNESASQLIQQRHENEMLRLRLRKLEEQLQQQQPVHGTKNATSANEEELAAQNAILKEKLDILYKDNVELKSEVYRLKSQVTQLDSVERQAAKQCFESENMLKEAKQRVEDMETRFRILQEELEDFRKNDRKNKAVIRQLESELEGALQSRGAGTFNRTKQAVQHDRSAAIQGSGASAKRSTSMPMRAQSPVRASTPRNAGTRQGIANKHRAALKNSSNKKRNSVDSDTESSRNRRASQTRYRQVSPARHNNSALSNSSSSIVNRKSPLKTSASKKQVHPRNSSPSLRSSQPKAPGGGSTGTQSKNKVVSSFKKSSNQSASNLKSSGYESEEDLRLMKKLETLRNKNKENAGNIQSQIEHSKAAIRSPHKTYTHGQQQQTFTLNNSHQEHTGLASPDIGDIDQKLSALQELLRQAKQ